MQGISDDWMKYIIITNCVEKYLSLKAQRLYRELLEKAIQRSNTKFMFNYKDLGEKLEYTKESLRLAFVELEKKGLALRETVGGTRILYVQINTKFFEEHLKGI